LLALVNEFERAVLPEFERRCREIRRRNADAAGEEVADVAAWDQVTTWLGTFLDSIAEHRATTFEGLRAKARAGLAVAPDAHHDDAMDNIDETIVASSSATCFQGADRKQVAVGARSRRAAPSGRLRPAHSSIGIRCELVER
jgi:hypothetical protein